MYPKPGDRPADNHSSDGGSLGWQFSGVISMRLRSLSLAVGLLCSFSAYAVLEVTVTKSRSIDSINTGAQTVITEEQIKNSTAATLPELLGLQAGIQSRSLFGNNGADDTVDLRGFGANASTNTLILLDGQRLNDVDISGVDFADIPLAVIEKIEIIRGSGGVLYGAGATAGVINIITKSAYSAEAYEAELNVDSLSTLAANFNAVGGSESVAYRINAGHKKSSGYRDNNQLIESTFFGDIRYKAESAELYSRINLDQQNMEFPGARRIVPGSGTNELVTDREGSSTPSDEGEQHGSRLLVGAVVQLTDDLDLINEIGGRRKELTSKFPSFFSGQYVYSVLEGLDVQPRLEWRKSIWGGEGKTTIGFDFSDTDYRSEKSATQASKNQPIHDVRIDQQRQAVYFQSQQKLTAALNSYFGYRHAAFEQDATDNFNPAAPGVSIFDSGAAPLKQDFDEPSYEAGLDVDVNDKVNVFLTYARSVRFGTVDEYFELDPSFAQTFSPLDPQITDVFNLGSTLNFSNTTSLKVTLFTSESENEIRFSPATFTNDNQDDITRRGAELSLNAKLTDAMQLALNLTRQDVAFSAGANKNKQVPLVSEQHMAAVYTWKINSNVSWSSSASYESDKFLDNDQSNTFGQKIPSVTLLNTALRYATRNFETVLSVNNLLDEEYYRYGVSSTFTPGNYNAYPLPGRVYSAGIKYKF